MQFFADHCVPRSIGDTLESEGHEVIRLSARLRVDAEDSAVIEESQKIGGSFYRSTGTLRISFGIRRRSMEASLHSKSGTAPRRFPQSWIGYSNIWGNIPIDRTTSGSFYWSKPIVSVFGAAHNPRWRRRKAFALIG